MAPRLPALSYSPTSAQIAEAFRPLAQEFNRTDRMAPIFGTDDGTATAYAINPVPGISVYEVGQVFNFQAAHANSGTAPTFNVNGKGAGTITYPDGSALAVGAIGAGMTIMVMVASVTPSLKFHLLSPGKQPTVPGYSWAVQTFSSSGTYTPTAGMIYAVIECVGGGGGGGGCFNPGAVSSTQAGGGGAGGYSRTLASAAAVGASKTVTIGAAGAAGTSGGGTGGAGGDTSVGTLCIGKGGAGGASASLGGLGGIAGTGDIAAPGAPGGGGANSGVNSYVGAGNGGSTVFGAGGRGSSGVAGAGSAALGYGGGGGGAGSYNAGGAFAGGAGSAGFVIVLEMVRT